MQPPEIVATVLEANTCLFQDCPDDYWYDTPNRECPPCHDYCDLCDGPDWFDNCTLCHPGAVL
jgi:hypothetical protein